MQIRRVTKSKTKKHGSHFRDENRTHPIRLKYTFNKLNSL